jgi:hypothetical protein
MKPTRTEKKGEGGETEKGRSIKNQIEKGEKARKNWNTKERRKREKRKEKKEIAMTSMTPKKRIDKLCKRTCRLVNVDDTL